MAEYVYTKKQAIDIGDTVEFKRTLIDKDKVIGLLDDLGDFLAFDDHYSEGFKDGIETAKTVLKSLKGEEPAHLCNSCKYTFPVCYARAEFEKCRDKILHCWKYESRTDNQA